MVESLRLVEAGHLDRPFHRRALAADGEVAVGLTRDRHDAAVDGGRIGAVDRDLGGAGGLAFC